MMVRITTLPFDPVVSGFDDTPLRDFPRDKEVHAVREYFFVRHDAPYLAVLGTSPVTPGRKQHGTRLLDGLEPSKTKGHAWPDRSRYGRSMVQEENRC